MELWFTFFLSIGFFTVSGGIWALHETNSFISRKARMSGGAAGSQGVLRLSDCHAAEFQVQHGR